MPKTTKTKEVSTSDITFKVIDQFRIAALDHAVRHRTREESPADVVKAAEKYLAFLEGK